MPATTTALLLRGQAVKRIAAHLADRDAYVIIGSPDTITTLTARLGTLTDWTAYLDSGTPAVLCTGQAPVIEVTSALIPIATVITVPKTTPAGTLSRLLDRDVPADGSQDILIVHAADGPICWPLLFVNALETVDPRAAAQIHAAHLPNLN